ncbi:MAG: hypothetical protein AB1347_11690 [Acidobacteriota bacterium]
MTGRAAAAGALAALFLVTVAVDVGAREEGTPEARNRVRIGCAGHLLPGLPLSVSWDPLPADVEEFELLLECGSPAWGKFRLTESDSPLQTHRILLLPRVPGEVARIVLRVGRGGREDTWATSRVFRVAGHGASPAARAVYHRGELWLDGRGAPPSRALESSGARLNPNPPSAPPGATVLPGPGGAPDPQKDRRCAVRTGRRGAPPSVREGAGRTPLLLPLRI